MNKSMSRFVFQKLDSVGQAAAEQDAFFLERCFVETEDLRSLYDINDKRQIVLGRTGAGKTALLNQFCKDEESRVSIIPPENLAMEYVSTSNVLGFLTQVGVDLDVVFRLLWRHVFVVEFLQMHFGVHDEDAQRNLLQRMLEKLPFQGKEKRIAEERRKAAISYLEKWGPSLFKSTENRIKEITSSIETNVKTALKVKVPHVDIDPEAARKMTTTQKQDVVHNIQEVISTIQIRELHDIMKVLNEDLNDPQKPYFIVIDRLDEKWVDNSIRYALIRALIETIRDFSREVRNVKILIALRTDLLETVLKHTQQSGFQEEKYQGLYLPLYWTDRRLTEILDARIDVLVKQRYTKEKVTHEMLLPKSVANNKAIDYILDRTLKRPRDVIAFVNHCINRAIDSGRITSDMVKAAEIEYSRGRLHSLGDEWNDVYPNLVRMVELLRNQRSIFSVSDLAQEYIEDFCLKEAVDGFLKEDDLSAAIIAVAEGKLKYTYFRQQALQAFYKVGMVGLRLGKYHNIAWSLDGRSNVAAADITDDARVEVHPMLHRAIGIAPVKTSGS